MTLLPWEYKALVPIQNFVAPIPVITRVLPGHDSRILSKVTIGENETVPIEIHFSVNMSCESVNKSLSFNSVTQDQAGVISLDTSSIECIPVSTDKPLYVGGVPTAWIFKANLTNVYNGVHRFTVNNATSLENVSTDVRPVKSIISAPC